MAKDINVKITGDAKDLERALGSASKATGRLGGAGRKMGIALAAGFAAVGTAAVIGGKKAIDAASDLNESINAVQVTFGKAAGKMLAFSETAARATGLSKRAFNELATPVGAMLRNMGLGADEAADATINLAKRAADMASVFNTDVSEAMQAIQAGLRGEADPLERFGVGLNAAAIEAQAVKMGLIGAGEEMTAQQKTQARLALLFQQTNRFAGDFVNTSDGLANSQRILKAEFENVTAEVGQALLPVATALMGVLARGLPPAIDLVRQGIQFLQTAFGNLGERFAGAGVKAEDVRAAFQTVAGWIKENLFPIIQRLGNIFTTAIARIAAVLQAHRPELERIWARVGAAIQGLAAVAIPILRLIFTQILPRVIGVAITVMDKWTGAVATVIRFVNRLRGAVATAMGAARSAVVRAVGGIVDAFNSVVGAIRTAIGWVERLIDAIRSIPRPSLPGSGILGAIGGKIPGFATGGVVPGPLGRPTLAVVHGGERITPPGRGTETINLILDGERIARAVRFHDGRWAMQNG